MKQKDDDLLELALVSDADFLITGDKDLLDIKKMGNCQILTATEFDIYSSSVGILLFCMKDWKNIMV